MSSNCPSSVLVSSELVKFQCQCHPTQDKRLSLRE